MRERGGSRDEGNVESSYIKMGRERTILSPADRRVHAIAHVRARLHALGPKRARNESAISRGKKAPPPSLSHLRGAGCLAKNGSSQGKPSFLVKS